MGTMAKNTVQEFTACSPSLLNIWGLATWHLCSQGDSASQGNFPIYLSCKSCGSNFYHMPKNNEKPGAVLGY